MQNVIYVQVPLDSTSIEEVLETTIGKLKTKYKDIALPENIEIDFTHLNAYVRDVNTLKTVMVTKDNAVMELSCSIEEETLEHALCLPTRGVSKRLYELLREIAIMFNGVVVGDPSLIEKFAELTGANISGDGREAWFEVEDAGGVDEGVIEVSEEFADACSRLHGILVVPNECVAAKSSLRRVIEVVGELGTRHEFAITGFDRGLGYPYIVGKVERDDTLVPYACIAVYHELNGNAVGDFVEEVRRNIQRKLMVRVGDDEVLSIEKDDDVVFICVNIDKLAYMKDAVELIKRVMSLVDEALARVMARVR